MAVQAASDSRRSMGRHAREEASRRLNRFAFQLRRASRSTDAEAIHDLRVSIRRLSQCLKVFGDFFPAREARKVRRRLRKILDIAADVRDRDIAMDLATKARVSGDSPVLAMLARDRKLAEMKLAAALGRRKLRNLSSQWRTRLGI